MHESTGISGADIHSRAFTNGIKAFENCEILCGIAIFGIYRWIYRWVNHWIEI
jgi:hypothetical protein